jgi:transcriptional regulator with XRE-family HTH domain
MPTSGRDPLKVPVQFWQRPDVTETLEARDIARLFRLLRKYCGASQTRIGTTVGMTQSTVSLIISRNTPVTTIAVLERIADGLGSHLRPGASASGTSSTSRSSTLTFAPISRGRA